MTVTIQEHYIKSERYGILAKALEAALQKLGYNMRISANTEVKNVGRGPETYVNFVLSQDND